MNQLQQYSINTSTSKFKDEEDYVQSQTYTRVGLKTFSGICIKEAPNGCHPNTKGYKL